MVGPREPETRAMEWGGFLGTGGVQGKGIECLGARRTAGILHPSLPLDTSVSIGKTTCLWGELHLGLGTVPGTLSPKAGACTG